MKRIALGLSITLFVLYVLLLIPGPDSGPSTTTSGTERSPFAWNQDTLWSQLEQRFVAARGAGCDRVGKSIDTLMGSTKTLLTFISSRQLEPLDPAFDRLEQLLFGAGTLVAACPDRSRDFALLVEQSRAIVKRQSEHWAMNDGATRRRLYRLLYGGRAAVEEVMLHMAPDSNSQALSMGTDEPSQTPWASILGIRIHSGDILVSRGGAPTSALIARGNDFPGNFSHVALVYVDPKSFLVSIIESHIERGAAIATIDDYLKDTKLRVMVLRLRADLPEMIADPMLPHRAAESALNEVRRRHVSYDFAMDFHDSTAWFCSEVASGAYASVGLHLWMGLSHISSPGLRSWLAAFGVRNFETQEPSDLEYDPQLRVVAEWRDPETLRKDHLDNAVTEVMLEGAESGERLTYSWYLLPIARVMKAYSSLLNVLGSIGPVPDGMSAVAALKNESYSGKHRAITEELALRARSFQEGRGFAPPYWDMVQLARGAKQAVETR